MPAHPTKGIRAAAWAFVLRLGWRWIWVVLEIAGLAGLYVEVIGRELSPVTWIAILAIGLATAAFLSFLSVWRELEDIKGARAHLEIKYPNRQRMETVVPFVILDMDGKKRYRVKVVNHGPAAASNVEAHLADIDGLGDTVLARSNLPRSLPRVDGAQNQAVINVGAEALYEFAHSYYQTTEEGSIFVLEGVYKTGYFPKKGDKWRLPVRVDAENADAQCLTLFLDCWGDGMDTGLILGRQSRRATKSSIDQT